MKQQMTCKLWMAYSLLSMTVLNKGGVSEIIRLYWSAETFKGCLQAHTASLAQTMYSETISNGVRTISNQPLIVFVYLTCGMIGCTLGLPCFSCRRQENIFLSIRKKECLKGRYSRLWRRRRHRAKYVSFHLHVCLMLWEACNQSTTGWPDHMMVQNPFYECNTWLYLPYFFITEKFLLRQ